MATKQRKAYINPSVGAAGLNLFDTARSIGDFQCRVMTAMIPAKGGGKSMYGYKVFNHDATKSGGIPLLHFYKKVDGTKQLIFSNADTYYYLPVTATSSTAWTTIGDYGTAVSSPHAVTCEDYVVFGTGLAGNTPKKWDGSAFTSIGSPASIGYDLLFYEFFQGQDFAALFGAGDSSNPSRLYYSDKDNPNAWNGGLSGYMDIYKDDGYKITGLKAQGDQLIIYKEKNRYFVSTFYESEKGIYGIRVQPYKDNAGGAIAHDTIEVLNNGDIVALVDKMRGVQGFGKNQSADGSLLPIDYSRDIRPILDNINFSYCYKAKAKVWDNMFFLSFPYGKQTTTNNFMLVLNLDTKGWMVLPDVSIASFEVGEDENGDECLYAGDSELPYIYKWDKALNTFNGDIIQGRMRTGRLNMGSIIDMDDLEIVAMEGFMQEGDELLLTFVVDGVEERYTIDSTFIVDLKSNSGYLLNDYIAEEYLPADSSDYDESEDVRWIALLFVNATQRRAREIEVQIENQNPGARWGWNYLSINEMDFMTAKLLPAKHILSTSATY